MKCSECPMFKSGCTSNACLLTGSENFSMTACCRLITEDGRLNPDDPWIRMEFGEDPSKHPSLRDIYEKTDGLHPMKVVVPVRHYSGSIPFCVLEIRNYDEMFGFYLNCAINALYPRNPNGERCPVKDPERIANQLKTYGYLSKPVQYRCHTVD